MEFEKYEQRGADYHWKQVSSNLRKRNAFVLGRYQNMVSLLNRFSNSKSAVVLDLGCGDGVLSYFLEKEGYSIRALDYSQAAIDAARDKLIHTSIEFVQGSAYELPFEDDAFDAVVSTEVIEHLDDVDAYLSEMRRVLKPDGIAIVSTPVRLTKAPVDPNHVQEWFREDFESLFSKRFGKVECFYSHSVMMTDLYFRPLLGRALFKLATNFTSLITNPFKGFFKVSQTKLANIQYAVLQGEASL